jgi:hypothetical protein
MKEYMLLIRNMVEHLVELSPEKNVDFLKSCQTYIGNLKSQGKLISAQPLVREGKIISGSGNSWNEVPFNESKEVIVGYYHIFAESMEDAIEIAKSNPEFAFTDTARIEVRPIKMKEEKTGFVYPKEG